MNSARLVRSFAPLFSLVVAACATSVSDHVPDGAGGGGGSAGGAGSAGIGGSAGSAGAGGSAGAAGSAGAGGSQGGSGGSGGQPSDGGAGGADAATGPTDPTQWAPETEPNDSISQANALPSGKGGFLGALSSGTDVDVYSFDVTVAGSRVLLAVGDGGGATPGSTWACPLPAGQGTLLTLFDANGKELASDSDSGPDLCSLIDPAQNAGARNLPIGKYFAKVELLTWNAVPWYVLGIAVLPPICGDGAVQPQIGEQCDDGNSVAGDGCSSTCKIEPGFERDICNGEVLALTGTGTGPRTGSVSGTTVTLKSDYAGSCGSSDLSSDAVFAITPDVDGKVTATLTTASFDSVLYARTTCTQASTELACDDTGGYGGESITFVATANTTYFLFVDGYDGDSGTFTLDVTEQAAGCGNSVLEGTEQCDDGNVTDGDGCSATCQWESGSTVDVCPGVAINLVGTGSAPRAASIASTTTNLASDYAGSCGSSGTSKDAVFAVTPDVSGTLTAEVVHDSGWDAVVYARSKCNQTTTELDCDDVGMSSADTVTFPATGGVTYYVVVDGYAGDSGVFTLNLKLAPPICGNGVVESPEQCDDGNTASGDGCSGACETEPPPAYDVCPGVALTLAGTGTDPRTATVSGATLALANDYQSTSCGGTAGDAIFSVTPDVAGTLTATLTTANFQSILAGRSTCTSQTSQLECDGGGAGAHTGNGGQRISFPVVSGTTYFLLVDGYAGAKGTFSLDVSIQ